MYRLCIRAGAVQSLFMQCDQSRGECDVFNSNVTIMIYIFTTIVLSPGGSGYVTCKQNVKSVTAKCKSGGLHEKHVVATWNVGNRLSVCL